MWKPEISYKEFEQNYIERSRISKEEYYKYKITLPCDCGEDGCQGWAAISVQPDSVHHHCQFNFPPIVDYLKYANKHMPGLVRG